MLSNELMSIIFGCLFGFIIILMINKPVYHGPNSNVIRKQIFKQNGKCYKFNPVVHICPKYK
jgi:hypothetical protein